MTEDDLQQAFFVLTEKGEFDRLLSQMRTKWNSIPREEVRQCIQDASEEVVRRAKTGQSVTNFGGLLRTITDRMLGKLWNEMRDARDAQAAMERLAAQGVLWRHDSESIDRIKRAADYVRSLLPKLDNLNWQRTIGAILDATVEGRQAENKDLATVLDAKPDTVGKWKERASARLAEIVRQEGYGSLDVLLNSPAVENEEEDDEDHDYDEELEDD